MIEKDRKRKDLEKKKLEKMDSPKVSKSSFSRNEEALMNLDMTYPSIGKNTISDHGSSMPVQGLPPGILLGNYTDKVMTNITGIFKVSYCPAFSIIQF